MELNTLKPASGSKSPRRRVGRGIGSGLGKTAGRGHKGQKSRAGGFHKIGFEGGQMPLQRRLPKRGFTSLTKKFIQEVRLSELQKLTADEVDLSLLKQAGIVSVLARQAKIIATGELKRKVSLRGLRMTKGARIAIEAAGGSISDLKPESFLATRPNPAKTGQSAPKYGDLLKRGIFLLLALVVYRIGAHIPVPGIDPDQLSKLFQSQAGGILGMFNLFRRRPITFYGICIRHHALYLGIDRDAIADDGLCAIGSAKKGRAGGSEKDYAIYALFCVALATFQAFGIAMALEKQAGLVIDPGIMFRLMTVLTLVTGTMFLMWLGEQITERGLGNGISIIIFAGIAAGLPNAIGGLFELVRTHSMSIISALLIIVLVAAVTYLVVFIERGQRKILVNYAKRQVGNKMYGGQSSHLPLKLNMAGVIPPIFASSIILFPATIASWFSAGAGTRWLQHIATLLAPGQPPYVILYALAIVFFCFFYTALVFNSRETADNLKKSGAFVPGIRPGKQTARYIDKILTRLTLAGAIYIVFVCLLPEFLVLRWNVPFYFGGTSLLIIVVVTMDFMEQARSYLMSQQYESLLRKANFKGGKFPVR